jgi:hypothetical protein
MDIKGEDVLRFQVKRNVTVLFKQFLIILEDLAAEHDIALDKLVEKLPPEYKDFVDLADYLSQDKSDLLRKKVLTIGNDCLRNLDEQLSNYDIQIKKA